MFRKTGTRRTVLKGNGAPGTATAVPTAAAAVEWSVEATPTDVALHDVADTSEGAHAVGGDGVADSNGGF